MKKVIALMPVTDKQVITTRETAQKNNWWITYDVEVCPEHSEKPHPDNSLKVPYEGMLLKGVNGNVYKISKLEEVRICFTCKATATHRVNQKFYCLQHYNYLVITQPIKKINGTQQRNSKCVCGSGLKYKNCCSKNIDSTRGHYYVNRINPPAAIHKSI